MERHLPGRVRDLLRGWCEAQRIELCYLYGSRARGTARADSDYDVALRFSRPMSVDERERGLADLQETLAKGLRLPETRFDIHDLDEMPLALQYRVVRDGVLLWESPRGAHSGFYVRVLGEYFDYRYYEEMHLERMRERIREGRFGA